MQGDRNAGDRGYKLIYHEGDWGYQIIHSVLDTESQQNSALPLLNIFKENCPKHNAVSGLVIHMQRMFSSVIFTFHAEFFVFSTKCATNTENFWLCLHRSGPDVLRGMTYLTGDSITPS